MRRIRVAPGAVGRVVGVAADAVGGTISGPENPMGRVTRPERPKSTIIKCVRGKGVRSLS